MPDTPAIQSNVVHGTWPVVVSIVTSPVPPGDNWVAWREWMPTISDIPLWGGTIMLAVGGWLSWFVMSPWPVAVSATIGALIGPLLLWARYKDAKHRQEISRITLENLKRSSSNG